MAIRSHKQPTPFDKFADLEFVFLCSVMGWPDVPLEEEPDPYTIEPTDPDLVEYLDLMH